MAITDAGGNVTDACAFDSFGVLANSDGDSPQPYRFLGRHGIMDDGTGLYHARARYFSPQLGRFLTKDPLTGKDSDGQSLNRYVYALSNPLLYTDATGLSPSEGRFHSDLPPTLYVGSPVFVILALGNYFCGSAVIPCSQLPTLYAHASDFPLDTSRLRPYLENEAMKARAAGNATATVVLNVSATGSSFASKAIIGQITHQLQGAITIEPGGSTWFFSGNVSFPVEDTYNFDTNKGRTFWAEASTIVGSLLPGQPYKIQIEGSQPFRLSGSLPQP